MSCFPYWESIEIDEDCDTLKPSGPISREQLLFGLIQFGPYVSAITVPRSFNISREVEIQVTNSILKFHIRADQTKQLLFELAACTLADRTLSHSLFTRTTWNIVGVGRVFLLFSFSFNFNNTEEYLFECLINYVLFENVLDTEPSNTRVEKFYK